MGQITAGIGLISGLPIADLVDQLMAIEARPKDLIDQRTAVLRSTQIAYQAVNAQLLGLKGAASGLVTDRVFDATQATSSNESIVAISSDDTAAPGNYTFRVKRLVGSQQTITRGFADTDATFVGAGTLTFDRGLARLDAKTQLNDLNGGEGVERGFIRVTDRSGAVGVVDLTDAVTVDDVVTAINSTLTVSVIASVTGDRLTITDNTGLTNNDLIISDIGTSATATGLGIAGSDAAGTITGAAINTIGEKTLLTKLNDGNGISTAGGQSDFSITDGGGTSFDINIINEVTVGDLIETINDAASAAGSGVTASINANGVGLTLTDAGGGGSSFTVAALNNSNAATDLGILQTDDDADGVITGARILATINSKLLRNINGGQGLGSTTGLGPPTLQNTTPLADLFGGAGLTTSGNALFEVRIQDKLGNLHFIDFDQATTAADLAALFNSVTGGAVTLGFNGNAFEATDNTGGGGDFRLILPGGGAPALVELGLNQTVTGNVITGVDTNPLPQPTTQSGAGVIRITNRAGVSTDVDLTTALSVSDALDAINASGTGVTASLNNAGNGITLVDTTGDTGDLQITDVTGATAAALGLAGTFVDQDEVDGGNLDFQYITEARRIEDLGVTRGVFRITDSSGQSATVDLTQGNEVTIRDVLDEINSRGLAINARLNDSGDGIVIEDLGPGTLKLRVEDEGASTAADLGILGEAENIGDDLDGSFQTSITIEATDTLTAVRNKINEANLGVSASIINDGSLGAPFRLSLNANQAGTGGAFVFDDGGLGFDAFDLADAQDAVVFFGGGDPADALVITSKSNTLSSLVPGATIDLLTTSNEPVQINISRDDQAIVDGVRGFVSSFNGLIDTITEHDSFNSETEERGLLLGDPTVNSVKQTIFNAVIRRNTELSGQFTALSQIGVTVGTGGRLSFDESKFRSALEADRAAVEELFTLRQTEEDENGDEVVTARGVGVVIDELLARLTDSEFGPIQVRVDGIDDQIRLNEQRVEDLDELLAVKRQRLEAQFVAMERALAELQGQSSALLSFQPLQVSSLSQNNNNS